MSSHPLEKNYKCHISEKKRSLRHRNTLGLVGKVYQVVMGSQRRWKPVGYKFVGKFGLTRNWLAMAYLLLWPL